MTPEPRFSESEAKKLLQRASEIHAARSLVEGTAGLSMDDLKALAIQEGIDPEAVDQAVLERLEPALLPGEKACFLTGEFDPEDFAVLDQALGISRSGQPPLIRGASACRRITAGPGLALLRVTSRGGASKISVSPVQHSVEVRVMAPLCLMGVVAGVAAGVILSPVVGFAVILAFLLAAVLGGSLGREAQAKRVDEIFHLASRAAARNLAEQRGFSHRALDAAEELESERLSP